MPLDNLWIESGGKGTPEINSSGFIHVAPDAVYAGPGKFPDEFTPPLPHGRIDEVRKVAGPGPNPPGYEIPLLSTTKHIIFKAVFVGLIGRALL